MIIEAKPMLLRTREAYVDLLAKREVQLNAYFEVPEDPDGKVTEARADIEAIEDMINAIDNELNNKH